VIVFNAMQALTSMTHSGIGSQLFWLPINWTVLAQHIDDPNLLGNVQRAFDHFVQTGQVWALLIGVILGFFVQPLEKGE